MSVLGTGMYSVCTYKGKNASTETRFIQEASLNDVGADTWSENDRVFIMLTSFAKKTNWDKDITEREKSDKTKVPYSGLELHLEKMKLACPVIPVDIPDGKDEAEMWDIFNRIFEILEPEDELYLDLTHAFRYLPMLLLILGNYAKFLKNVKVAYMSYGNYEARSRNEDDHSKDVAPIVDLLPLATLQDWTTAASSFKETGRVDVLNQTINKIATGLPDKNHRRHLSNLRNSLKVFQQQIETCRGGKIKEKKAAEDICKFVDIVRQDNSLPAPTSPILQSIKTAVQPFDSDSIKNIPAALQWCKRFGLVQQGYTLCQEGIVTLVCEKLSEFNPFTGKSSIRDYRDYWSAVLGLNDIKVPDESKWTGLLAAHIELTRSILALDWVKRLRVKYGQLTANRNTVNHGGFTGNITAEAIVEQFNSIVDDCMECFDWELTPPATSKAADRPAIFINLSNHPAEKWSEAQKEAARQYGELQEIPFPNVGPDADAETMKKIVEETLRQVKETAEGKTATVHVMGEMTLTYALVSKLKEVGIRCVASTTNRDVTENADGTRTSKFNFVKFREY